MRNSSKSTLLTATLIALSLGAGTLARAREFGIADRGETHFAGATARMRGDARLPINALPRVGGRMQGVAGPSGYASWPRWFRRWRIPECYSLPC